MRVTRYSRLLAGLAILYESGMYRGDVVVSATTPRMSCLNRLPCRWGDWAYERKREAADVVEADAFVRWWSLCTMFTLWQQKASKGREDKQWTMCVARIHLNCCIRSIRVLELWRLAAVYWR